MVSTSPILPNTPSGTSGFPTPHQTQVASKISNILQDHGFPNLKVIASLLGSHITVGVPDGPDCTNEYNRAISVLKENGVQDNDGILTLENIEVVVAENVALRRIVP